jgi:hypothetical protein
MSKASDRRRVVKEELEGVKLGDERRSKRAMAIAERLAESPESSLPAAMGDRAAVEALYRHLASDEATLEAVLAPHVAKTMQRVAALDTVYAVADTTNFVFSGDAERQGLGPINGKDQGFLAHLTLAVAPDRMPLGVLGVQVWSRSERREKRDFWSRRNDHRRESLRWARGMMQTQEQLGDDAQRLVHVADREGDIYELLAALVHQKQRFIVRAAQDRRLVPLDKDDEAYLFDAAQCTRTAFVLDVPLSARKRSRLPERSKTFPGRRERVAQLSFAARTVTMRRPLHGTAKLPPSITINIVHVFELGPPLGEPPVEWLLLTNEPVRTDAEIQQVVAGYRARWVIEEYFKAVKTGCAFESRQLESAHTLQALLAYTLIVAYALLLLRSLSRTGRDEDASILLSPVQLSVLRAKNRKLPAHPTVRQALLAIAEMGGHLKNNGDPGWRTLSKGWAKLVALAEGYELARALGRSDQS